MTTVLNPLSSPIIAYNKSGKTIQNVNPAAGSSFVTATTIPSISEHTVLLVDTSDGSPPNIEAIALDAAFDVGDTVDIVLTAGGAVNVYSSDGSGHGTVLSATPYGGWIKFGTGLSDWIQYY